MSRILRWATPLIVLLAGGAAVWALRHPAPRRPDVLVITLDTLRADSVGKDKGTPAIEAFLTEATHFPGGRTVAPLTVPAHASLFTGFLPARHGMHENATAPLPPRGERTFPLLAEELRGAGYATAAFIARAVLAPETGLDGGFDVYDCPELDEAKLAPLGYRRGSEQVDRALAWLAKQPAERPYFCWVHLFDAHTPYTPFEGDARRPGSHASDDARMLYAGEVRRVDAAVERLLAAVGPDTIVVLVSDHGESLGDHDEPTHGALVYGSTIDAFLAVRGPGLAAGAVAPGPRSICDIAPTLRQWCGLEKRDADGVPLTGPPAEVVLAESLFTWRIHGWGQCFAASDGRFTLIESGSRVRLYDRERDPKERHPLAPEGHEAYERLDRAISAMRALPSAGSGGEMLPSLAPYAAYRRSDADAYLPRRENAARPDPEALVPAWSRMTLLAGLLDQAAAAGAANRVRDLVRALEETVRGIPPTPLSWVHLGRAYGQQAALEMDGAIRDRAVLAFVQAIDLGYTGSDVLAEALHAGAPAALSSGALRALLEAALRAGIAPDERAVQALRAAATDDGAAKALVEGLLARAPGSA